MPARSRVRSATRPSLRRAGCPAPRRRPRRETRSPGRAWLADEAAHREAGRGGHPRDRVSQRLRGAPPPARLSAVRTHHLARELRQRPPLARSARGARPTTRAANRSAPPWRAAGPGSRSPRGFVSPVPPASCPSASVKFSPADNTVRALRTDGERPFRAGTALSILAAVDAIAPRFYEKDANGIPRTRVAAVKSSIATLCPCYNTHRVVEELVDRYFVPASRRAETLASSRPETPDRPCSYSYSSRKASEFENEYEYRPSA